MMFPRLASKLKVMVLPTSVAVIVRSWNVFASIPPYVVIGFETVSKEGVAEDYRKCNCQKGRDLAACVRRIQRRGITDVTLVETT